MTTAPTPAGGRRRAGAARALLLLALIGLLAGLVRCRLLDVPLERDEGGFAVMARLILDGVPPYAGAYDDKPPGLYLANAAFIALFGGGAAGIHLGLLATSLGTMVLLYALVRRWSGEAGALVAAFLSQAFLVSTSLLGFAAHATHFVVFCSLAGFLLMERGLDREAPPRRPWLTLVAAGAAFGAATLMKQSGAVFFLAALVVPFVRRPPGDERGRHTPGGEGVPRPLAASALLIAGFIIPLAVVAGWLARSGALDAFLYWNVTYPSLVASGSEATGIVPRLFRNGLRAAGSYLPAWIAGAAAFAWLMRRASGFRWRWPMALFFAASAASVAVGYETRTHYFVLLGQEPRVPRHHPPRRDAHPGHQRQREEDFTPADRGEPVRVEEREVDGVDGLREVRQVGDGGVRRAVGQGKGPERRDGPAHALRDEGDRAGGGRQEEERRLLRQEGAPRGARA